jgi:hypothetical protein
METAKAKGKRCPTPKKIQFRDRIAAALFAGTDKSSRRGGYGAGRVRAVVPYRCPAGHWHVKSARKST